MESFYLGELRDLSDKIYELNLFLQEYSGDKHVGNVIDIAIDIIKGQDSLIKDLEDILKTLKSYYENFDREMEMEKYVCHEKCQDVVSIDSVRESLFPFEVLINEKD